jgi:hypothetical protein
MSNKSKKRGILNQVVEEPIVEETNLVTEEEVVAQEEFINEAPVEAPVEEPVAEESFEVEPPVEEPVVDPVTGNVNVKFEFQDEYHFGPGNGDAVIDTLPEEEKLPVTDCSDPDCPCNNEVEPCVCEKPCVCEEPAPIVEAPVKAPRSVASLTRAELHRFNTTGIMPE